MIDTRVYYHGWDKATKIGDLPGWRYYPDRTTHADAFAIRIYTDDRTIDIYEGPPDYASNANKDIYFPDSVVTDEEMQAWAIAVWRMG
jgi:hypothetical protein